LKIFENVFYKALFMSALVLPQQSFAMNSCSDLLRTSTITDELQSVVDAAVSKFNSYNIEYFAEGCEVRSFYLSMELAVRGIPSDSIAVVLPQPADVEFSMPVTSLRLKPLQFEIPGVPEGWGYHVVPVIRLEKNTDNTFSLSSKSVKYAGIRIINGKPVTEYNFNDMKSIDYIIDTSLYPEQPMQTMVSWLRDVGANRLGFNGYASILDATRPSIYIPYQYRKYAVELLAQPNGIMIKERFGDHLTVLSQRTTSDHLPLFLKSSFINLLSEFMRLIRVHDLLPVDFNSLDRDSKNRILQDIRIKKLEQMLRVLARSKELYTKLDLMGLIIHDTATDTFNSAESLIDIWKQ